MVKVTRFDVEASRKKGEAKRAIKKKFLDEIYSIMDPFVIELAAKTGRKYEFRGTGNHRDILEEKGWLFPSREKIGEIQVTTNYKKGRIEWVEVNLFDGSIDKDFSLQVELFEKKLRKVNFNGHIKFKKVW